MTRGLFRPGWFSPPRPGFEPLSVDEARPVKQVLARLYPGLHPGAIGRVKAFGLNSSNWRIRSDKGTFILKRAAKEKTGLAAQARWTQALSSSGFPAVSFIAASSSALVAADGDHLYCLSRFEEGSHLGASVKRWEDLLRREQELLRWCRRHAPRGAKWPRRDILTADERRVPARAGRRLGGADGAYVRRKFAELEALHRGGRDLTRGLFHIDIHPLNVLFRGDRLVLLADFDSFCVTTLEVSLGFSLFKCARELLVGLPPAAFERRVRRLERLAGDRFGRSFAELLAYGQLDLMKRLLGVVAAGSGSPWSFMLETQLLGLKEADAMRAACVKLKSDQR